jgi:hypothetical protein
MADEPIAQSALDKPEVAEAPAPVTAAAETAAMNKRLATQTDVDITMGGTAADNGDSVHVSTTEGI